MIMRQNRQNNDPNNGIPARPKGVESSQGMNQPLVDHWDRPHPLQHYDEDQPSGFKSSGHGMDESEANVQIAALREIADKWDNPLAMAGS